MKVGVLALQGAFGLHVEMLRGLGFAAVEVRRPDQLDGTDALVVPGGESTTMSMVAERSGLLAPLGDYVRSGRRVLGTCAGAILLASEVLDGRDDQHCLAAVDISVRRNAFGPQVDSFEVDLEVPALQAAGMSGEPFRAVCIRAPVIERTGPEVEVLARIDGRPALVREQAVTLCIFHPELVADPRVHQLALAN